MEEFRDRVLNGWKDSGTGAHYSSAAFYKCWFVGCAFSKTRSVDLISTASDILVKDCEDHAVNIGPGILRRVVVDGLITGPLLILWGTMFDQVVLRGRIGKIKVNRSISPSATKAEQAAFDQFRRRFYDAVDCALDIREARFRHFDVSGIPARLIRRDPETQMVVTRESAATPRWREKVRPGNTLWPFMIQSFMAGDEDDMVLVAPKQGPKRQCQKLLDELRELRELGVDS